MGWSLNTVMGWSLNAVMGWSLNTAQTLALQKILFCCRTCLRYFTVFFLLVSSVLFARVLASLTGTSLLICVPKSWHENAIFTFLFFFLRKRTKLFCTPKIYSVQFSKQHLQPVSYMNNCVSPVSYTTLSLMLRRVITKYFVNDWRGELAFDVLYNLSFDCILQLH